MMNQNNATPVNYLNPEATSEHKIYRFPSMATPQEMPEAKYKNDTETDKIIFNTIGNVFWAVAVVLLSIFNVVGTDLMAASIISNIVLTLGALCKKSAKMAKFVTDLNLGLVTLSIIAFICKAIF